MAESAAGEGGWGGISILGLQNPALPNRTPSFPSPRWIGGGVFPTRSSAGGGKVPALRLGGGESAGSKPLTPGWVKAAPRGRTDFPAATPGSGRFFSNPGEASGGNGRTGLICNEFCPLALGEKIFIALDF